MICQSNPLKLHSSALIPITLTSNTSSATEDTMIKMKSYEIKQTTKRSTNTPSSIAANSTSPITRNINSRSVIEWMNDHFFKPGYLASIQAVELKELKESPERLVELEADLQTLSDEIGADYELHLKPELFPEELWKFVCKQ